MTVSRRDALKALAATVAFGAIGRAWPGTTLSAQALPGRRWVNKHGNLSEPVWRYLDVRNDRLTVGTAAPDAWHGGLTRIRAILQDAQANGRRVRARLMPRST